MTQEPPKRLGRITSDGLRSCATPRGRLYADFAEVVRLPFHGNRFDEC